MTNRTLEENIEIIADAAATIAESLSGGDTEVSSKKSAKPSAKPAPKAKAKAKPKAKAKAKPKAKAASVFDDDDDDDDDDLSSTFGGDEDEGDEVTIETLQNDARQLKKAYGIKVVEGWLARFGVKKLGSADEDDWPELHELAQEALEDGEEVIMDSDA